MDSLATRLDKSNLRMQSAYAGLYHTNSELMAANKKNAEAQDEWRATIDEREALMNEITGKEIELPGTWVAEG